MRSIFPFFTNYSVCDILLQQNQEMKSPFLYLQLLSIFPFALNTPLHLLAMGQLQRAISPSFVEHGMIILAFFMLPSSYKRLNDFFFTNKTKGSTFLGQRVVLRCAFFILLKGNNVGTKFLPFFLPWVEMFSLEMRSLLVTNGEHERKDERMLISHWAIDCVSTAACCHTLSTKIDSYLLKS